jgi:hypothetical protein
MHTSRRNIVAGYFVDASLARHGFVRTGGGAITTFDAPGAAEGAYQGTSPQPYTT